MASEEMTDPERAVRVALGSPDILRLIFAYLPLKDLKECSSVNTFWNFEVRSYIRDYRECAVHIFGNQVCHRLSALSQIVSDMTVVPITGLKLSWSHCDQLECKKLTAEEPTLFYGELFRKLPLKCLRLVVPLHKFEPDGCLAIKFIVDLLSENSNELQALQCTRIPPEFGNLFDQDWTPSFQKLRVLDLGDYAIWVELGDFYSKIINGAPNLRKLKGIVYPFLLRWIPIECYSMLDHFNLTISSDREKERCLQVAKAGPSLSCLDVDGPGDRDAHYKPSFFRCLEELLRSSRNSLQEFKMKDQLFALNQLECSALANIKKLIVCTSCKAAELMSLLETTDYSKQLPALAQVELEIAFQNPFQEEHFTAANGQALHASTTVKYLGLSGDDSNWPTCRRLSKIYPNVRHVEFIPTNLAAIEYDAMCSSWPQLESIYLKVFVLYGYSNFDAEFLGVSPAELDLLRELDDGALENMNIVPTRPSVLALPYLKRLEIEIGYGGGTLGAEETEPFLFSRLTGVLEFRKLKERGANVRISTPDKKHYSCLQHLQPYVPVMLKTTEF